MKIGNFEAENNVFLAPMAGITDLPFRVLAREKGAGMVYSEMVSAKGIIYNNENTKSLLMISDYEKPVAVQLFGSDPDVLAETVKRIEEYDFALIDINMGCPAPKIVRNGEGSALMKDLPLIGKIVYKASRASKKPVTVKIRKGFSENSVNAVEAAKIAEDNGASAVCVHGRTREQYYSGKADWGIIAAVKNAVSIPVIGNGDIRSAADAKRMLEETGCDGVMIGRAADGNPWIFRDIIHYLKTGELLESPSIDEKIATALRHTEMLVELKSEYIAVREMRRHLCAYVKGEKGAAEARVNINKSESLEDIKEILIGLI